MENPLGEKKPRKHSGTFYRLNVALVFVLGVLIFISLPPSHAATYDTLGTYVSPQASIRIAFDRPVNRKIVATIEPEVAGNWTYENFAYSTHLARTLTFTPIVSFAPGTEYKVHLAGVRNVLTAQGKSQNIEFTLLTPPVPSVKEVTPAQTDILRPDASWAVALDVANDQLASFDFVFDPAVEAAATLNAEKTQYTVTPNEPLHQGTEYTLTIFRKNVQYFVGTQTVVHASDPAQAFTGAWKTREAPGIKDFTPTGDAVKKGEKIAVTFSESMDAKSVTEHITIDPKLAGSWKADADKKTFTHSSGPLALGTTYTVTIPKGVKTASGGYFENDAPYTFTTLGNVTVNHFSPGDSSTGAGVSSTVEVTFNQDVNHASAEKVFSFSPAVSGKISWNGNTMLFKPDNALAYNSSYAVKIAKGVKSVDGLDSNKEFSASFSTELSQTKLAATFHRQERPLSCEAAALTMALRYKGVNVSESALIDQIGFDTTPHKDGVWGNPHVAFVGDYYGKQVTTGYGVYWEPIARVGALYRSTRYFTNGTVQDLTKEIQKGNPVIVWGNASSGRRADWKTKDGQSIIAIVGEHARVVIGFIGSADNPSRIITLDPLSGERYFTTSAFEANWSLLQRGAVVVE